MVSHCSSFRAVGVGVAGAVAAAPNTCSLARCGIQVVEALQLLPMIALQMISDGVKFLGAQAL